MHNRAPLIFLVIICIIGIYIYNRQQEGFFNYPDTNFITNSNNKYTGISPLINILNPVIAPTLQNSNKIIEATYGLHATPTETSHTLTANKSFIPPDTSSETLAKIKMCEAVTVPSCDAFNDSQFSANCGISFDKNGKGSDGKPHMGGFYISENDRQQQTIQSENDNQQHEIGWYFQPTIGKVARGKFAIAKDQCTILKEKVDCETNQSFGSTNCTQCYTSQHFSRVGPENGLIPFTINIVGNGSVSVTSSKPDIKLSSTTLSTTSISIPIPSDSEGTEFHITVTSGTTFPTFVAGYIQGDTASGPFKLDVTAIIKTDATSQSKARIAGSIVADGVTCIRVIPAKGKSSMDLVCTIPFSFLNMYDDASVCQNGPIITKASSATFLESDPCFGKANSPGNYRMECLQSRWLSIGGTQDGTGYPSTTNKANSLQRGPNGKLYDIDTIIDNLTNWITQGLTGKDMSGKQLSITDWNRYSTFATGKTISTPCDGGDPDGKLSKECLVYLYNNEGKKSHIGGTYTSMIGTYCKPNTEIDPNTEAGLAFSQSITGGINDAKRTYDQIHQLANDNTKTNAQRATAIKQCYGVAVDSSAVSNSLVNSNLSSFIGRFIKLQYDHQECLNLAQIQVYSDDTDENIVNPTMSVQKPSGWNGNDYYPVKNFIDGVGNTFVHTSCYDVPYIILDLGVPTPIYKIVVTNRKDCCQSRVLGTVLTVMDANNKVLYTADPIKTVSATYTWFPPKPEVYGDLPSGAPLPPRQTVYGNNGSVSCDTYCAGAGGRPWNSELPYDWNGAKCVGHSSSVPNCFSGFSSGQCICEATGNGWN
jgi:hypothetical protein